jgi:hypothetical protein
MNRAAHLLLVLAARIMPREHAEWAAAMRAEAATLSGHRAITWAAGCVVATTWQRLRHERSLHVLLMPALSAAFLYVDWNTIDTTLSLTVLLLAAGLPAYVCPQRTLVTGIVVGAVATGAHALADITWTLVPYYQVRRLDLWDWMIISSLIAPSLAGAYVGGLLRRIVTTARA